MKTFIKGKTVDEKFKYLEQTLKHFSRRLSKTIIGVVPPMPMFNYVENVGGDGIILRCIFPAPGKIITGCLFVEEYLDKSPVKFEARLAGPLTEARQDIVTKKTLTILKPDLSVGVGDRLTVTAEPGKERGVWVGFLYEVGMNLMAQKEFLIDEFVKLIEKEEK